MILVRLPRNTIYDIIKGVYLIFKLLLFTFFFTQSCIW